MRANAAHGIAQDFTEHVMPSSPASPPISVPRYAPLQPDEAAAAHLLVAQASALREYAAFAAQLAAHANADALVLGESAPMPGHRVRYTRSPDELESLLSQRLDASAVGLRLYLCGDEAFIWRIHRIAAASGMRDDEIRSMASGSLRSVYCVHCGEVHDYRPDNEVLCAGCSLFLGVRQHFSRLLGAYIGVCADPDRPYAEAHP